MTVTKTGIYNLALSLIKEGNHAYAKVLFINNAAERNEKLVEIFLNKEMVQNKDRSHTE